MKLSYYDNVYRHFGDPLYLMQLLDLWEDLNEICTESGPLKSDYVPFDLFVSHFSQKEHWKELLKQPKLPFLDFLNREIMTKENEINATAPST